jgi:hypothetical protein
MGSWEVIANRYGRRWRGGGGGWQENAVEWADGAGGGNYRLKKELAKRQEHMLIN